MDGAAVPGGRVAATVTAHSFQCIACDGVYFDRSPEGGSYHHVCPPLPPDKKGKIPVREDARDENLAPTRNGWTPPIKSEGAGVKCLSDPELSEPVWITGLKMRIAKEDAADSPAVELTDENE